MIDIEGPYKAKRPAREVIWDGICWACAIGMLLMIVFAEFPGPQ